MPRDNTGEPIPREGPPFTWQGYKVDVMLDGKLLGPFQATSPRALEELLMTLGQRYAFAPQFYDADANPLPRPQVLFSVYDLAREAWVKADGVTEMQDGAIWMNVEVKLHIGSVILPK